MSRPLTHIPRLASFPERAALPRQRGVALVVVLVLLLAISAVAVWSVRRSLTGEGLARNQIDQQAARQAAESALRDAERDIMNTSVAALKNASCTRGKEQFDASMFTSDCAMGLCRKPDSEYATVNWKSATSSNKSIAEPWWPIGKGGLWASGTDDGHGKPDRTAASVDTGQCGFRGGVPIGTYSGVAPIRGVARQPEYIIEIFQRKNVRVNQPEPQVVSIGENANQWSIMYRITARGFGYSEKTQTVLQTIYFP